MTKPLQSLQVCDFMQPKPVSVFEDSPLDEIFHLFSNQSFYCLPVIDAQGELQGSISLNDLEKVRQLYDLREYLGIIMAGLEPDVRTHVQFGMNLDEPIDLVAREIMSVRRPCLHENEPVMTLINQLIEKNSNYAIVVNSNQQVTGILNTSDVLKRLQSYLVVPTL